MGPKKIDLRPYGYQGEGVPVSGLTPISVIEIPTNKDEERKKALESVFNLPRTSLSTILPPETDTEKNIVKEFVNVTPVKLTKKIEDPFTVDRAPGSGPVDVNEQLDFELMDIDQEELRGGKRRHRKMKTRKAVRKNKRRRSTKKRRTSVRRR
jgi:hypothetical protein